MGSKARSETEVPKPRKEVQSPTTDDSDPLVLVTGMVSYRLS